MEYAKMGKNWNTRTITARDVTKKIILNNSRNCGLTLSNMKIKSYHHLCYYQILLFLISHLVRGIESQTYPGYSINVSSHVTVQRGLCVYIPCSFTVPTTETLTGIAVGIWYKWRKTPVASNNRSFSSNGRFFLTGDVQRGDCSLYIENPLYEDGGSYYFKVEDNIRFNYQDIMSFIEVTGLTDKPEISPKKSWLEGEKVTLSCTSPGRCRGITPNITWKGNIHNFETNNHVINHENGTKTHFSNITFTSRREQNNSILSCTVQLEGRLTTKQEITIKVEYPPRPPEIKCSIISKDSNELQSNKDCAMDANNTIYPLQGSSLSLSCSADSVPESSMMWKSFSETKTFSTMHKLILANLSRANEGIYMCQATNIYGTSNTSVTIKVAYPARAPEIKCSIISKGSNELQSNKDCAMVANNTIYFPEGSTLSLSCSADSVPESSMVWKSSNETKTFSTMHKLILANLSRANEGIYMCQATNIYGTSNTSVTIKVAYPARAPEMFHH
ncbi:sialic acid-binding Ig-like lectin 14 isoform X3 [Pyxicephalus adspersus]|uniref:sialic acid-binding Ig-like lectin 14 isoform X3 n=1 Tax=Pyxicephalus adspersus TaxID=30357 RepID=UPI003B58F009